MSSRNDFTWKIVAGGEGGVGKTTFLFRYVSDRFLADTKLTVGCQCHSKTLVRDGYKIGLILWDMGGQERFRFIQDQYIKGAHAAFVMFSLDRDDSLIKTKNWIEMIRANTTPDIPILLVGTKADLVDEDTQAAFRDKVEKMLPDLDVNEYIFTSSKWGLNVEESVHKLIDALLAKKLRDRNGALQESTS